jgi:hypothetical protein
VLVSCGRAVESGCKGPVEASEGDEGSAIDGERLGCWALSGGEGLRAGKMLAGTTSRVGVVSKGCAWADKPDRGQCIGQSQSPVGTSEKGGLAQSQWIPI